VLKVTYGTNVGAFLTTDRTSVNNSSHNFWAEQATVLSQLHLVAAIV